MEELRERGLETRWLRASKMRTAKALFDEFAAALQFPPYFGENWDALDECLNDLDWLEGDGAALFIMNADQLLQDAPPDEGRILFEILQAAESNLPFHIVLQARDTSAVMEGLKAMGVDSRLLPPL
ncbi:MAG: barstar family protein [Holophagaceae bacterium]|nr:barstar family protein [Holophagaceae bacterium]